MQGYIVVQARPQYCSNSLIVNGLFDLSLALSVTSHPLCFCPHQDFMAPFLLQMCCLDKSEHQTWNIKYHVHPKCNTKKNVKIKTFAKSISNLPIKFIYSEKATKFCKISTVDLTGTTLDILHNFVTFSENMNFNKYSMEYLWDIL